MPDLIDLLRRFNRKERFFLIGEALDKRKFTLSEKFRERLFEAIGVKVPSDAFVAIDYHLDWIAASLAMHSNPNGEPFENRSEKVKGTQQDIDLLVGFKENETYHLILIEAKGYTGWNNEQLESKTKRLTQIFGVDRENHRGVTPHFWLTSPKRPQKIKADNWPGWMSKGGAPHWLKLCLPNDRLEVTRVGDYFRVVQSRERRRQNRLVGDTGRH